MTSMAQLGEKAFLRMLLPKLPQYENFVNGFGHDISIVDLGLEKNIAFKIDRAPVPVAISKGWSSYEVWGRLAVVANISDLLAANAVPKAFMLSITAPRSVDHLLLEQIVAGCVESCAEYNVSFVGGDTKEGDTLQVVGSCIGISEKDYYLGRGIAQPGDHLVIAGVLGDFMSACSMLDNKLFSDTYPRSLLMSLLTHPSARLRECTYVLEHRLAHASCDLSDGLADAISHFCSADIGVIVEETELPLNLAAVVSAAGTFKRSYELAFGAGDWAVAFVIPEQNMGLIDEPETTGLSLRSIGRFTATPEKLIRCVDGTLEKIPTAINEQFVARLEDDLDYLKMANPGRLVKTCL